MNIMKNLITCSFFFLSLSVHAEPSRKPAVLDSSCNLDIPTHITTISNGEEIVIEKTAAHVQKEQCSAIRKCMASAEEEELAELKSLADVACSAKLATINTRTPAIAPDKNFDGKRKAKEIISEENPSFTPADVKTKTK